MSLCLPSGAVVRVEPPETPVITIGGVPGPAVHVLPTAGPPGPPGPAGPPGDGGAAVSFRWNQTIPATVWTVVHELGRYPVVATVHSSDLSVSYAEFGVQHLDVSTLRITMDVALAGTALLI